jgi:hypothetical protein
MFLTISPHSRTNTDEVRNFISTASLCNKTLKSSSSYVSINFTMEIMQENGFNKLRNLKIIIEQYDRKCRSEYMVKRIHTNNNK